jgi:hypothetical protein
VSLDDSKPLAEEMAEMWRRMVEIGFTPDEVPSDVLIKAVILAGRRAKALEEEKESRRKVQPDVVASEEAKTA